MSTSKSSKGFIAKSSVHRLLRDVKQIMVNPLASNGIFYHHDEEDMLKGYAMIIGPEETPYFNGYYFFELNFPNNYPHSPPIVYFCTNGDGVRFNPNLYKTGKVCISILNTWRGEQWNSCQTISTLLLTICTLLCKDPLLNEPGVDRNHNDFSKYNRIVEYKNIEIGVLHLLNKHPTYWKPWFEIFYAEMIKHFVLNYSKTENHVSTFIENSRGKMKKIKTNLYSMEIEVNYIRLLEYMEETYTNVKKIIENDKTTYGEVYEILSLKKADT
jgi:ubiquitin-conjugating enzyme E2 Z